MVSDSEEMKSHNMIYDYKKTPPWHLALLLGFQHFLAMCFPNAIGTLILVNNMCLEDDSPIKSTLVSASFFVMGLTTFLQTTFGSRLPIIQGATFALIMPTISLLRMPDLASCNASENVYLKQWTNNATKPSSVFNLKMQMISGSFMVVSCVAIIVAISGVLNVVVRRISPLSLSSIYSVLALTIVDKIIQMMEKNWIISSTSSVLMILFIVVLSSTPVPCFFWSRRNGCQKTYLHIFRVSPIVLAISIMWFICLILTVTNGFPNNPDHWSYDARTDTRLRSINQAPFVKVPYPGQWGPPLISLSAVIGLTVGVLILIIESVGDYMATARICRAPRIPSFAINRGILMEGLGIFLSGLLGSTVAPTSYSDNIGLFQATKAGNRIITQFAALFMLLCGIFPIFGAICVSIPTPIIGGVSIIIVFLILGVGVGYLQNVNLYSVRNVLIFSSSVGFGIFIPTWLKSKTSVINTGISLCDEIILILLSQGLFIAAFLSILMDNILPGHYMKDCEVDVMNKSTENESDKYEAYDFFLFRSIALRCKWIQYLPLFPAYRTLQIAENENLKNEETTV